jgi:hypothetical protein
MTTPTLVAGSTSIGWSGGLNGNSSNQLIGTESITFPFLTAIQALDTTRNPAIVVAIAFASTGQGSSVGATLTIGGYSAQVIAECLVDNVGSSAIYLNTLLAVLPVTAAMAFVNATTVATVSGMASGGSPFVYGAVMRTALYYNVDPTANLNWAGGFTKAGSAGGVTSVSVPATLGQLAVSAWCNTTAAGTGHYTITNPTSDFTEALSTGLAGVSDGFGIVPSTGTFTATATAGGGAFPDAAAIVGLITGTVPGPPPTVPNVAGQTQAAGTAALISSGYQVTPQQVSSNLLGTGFIVFHNPSGGTVLQVGGNVTITVSTGPAKTAGTGGDRWGANGGDQNSEGTQEIIGHTLAQGAHSANAVVQTNQSILAAMSQGQSVTQNTPDLNMPTTPAVG